MVGGGGGGGGTKGARASAAGGATTALRPRQKFGRAVPTSFLLPDGKIEAASCGSLCARHGSSGSGEATVVVVVLVAAPVLLVTVVVTVGMVGRLGGENRNLRQKGERGVGSSSVRLINDPRSR